MKKITLLLSFVACVVFAQAGTNLLVNSGFETWATGAPTGWTIVSTTTGASAQSTTIINEGSSSFKVTGGTGTFTVNQAVPVTAGKTYTITMKYYIEAGDGTDARIWCNFKNADGKYWKMNLADSLAMKGPNATASAGYFPDVKSSWQTYTYDVVAPVGFEIMNYEFRTYKSPAVVYWDNLFFGEKTTAGITSPKADALDVKVIGKTLNVTNTAISSVEIFSTLGAKVQTIQLINGSADLNLAKGLYIVRAGNQTAKIRL